MAVYTCGRIPIEEWNIRGAHTTYAAVQKIEIRRNSAPKCKNVRGSIRLSLKEIHPRTEGPNETDLIISHRDMENLADPVWNEQFNQFLRTSFRNPRQLVFARWLEFSIAYCVLEGVWFTYPCVVDRRHQIHIIPSPLSFCSVTVHFRCSNILKVDNHMEWLPSESIVKEYNLLW